MLTKKLFLIIYWKISGISTILEKKKKNLEREIYMIVLQATPELRVTFTKLIQTMEVQVNWNGLFVVIDNTLILQGDVRSLFFHFDSRKVITNIIDLEIPLQKITLIEDNPYVKNVINMLLYAFGKWGNIKGLKVEKDYKQLSQLFTNILAELEVDSEYTKEHFWFFEKGVRIVYEDVMQAAIEHKEKAPEIAKEESRGLWHKLIWKHVYEDFGIEETTVKERNRNRLGNNFYLTSFLCPVCKNKMHGVVYPEGSEFIIDTDEGQVRLARSYTCSKCCSFYTPRPDRLLIDGDCYIMDFTGDRVAYEDYQELLGKKGARVCNYNFNEYVNKRASAVAAAVRKPKETFELPELKRVLDEVENLSDRDFERLFAAIQEGYYPENEVELIERILWKEQKERKSGKKRDVDKNKRDSNAKQSPRNNAEISEGKKDRTTTDSELTLENKKLNEKISRYKTRLELFPRLSERQRNELLKQISSDAFLDEHQRAELLDSAKYLRRKDTYDKLKEKVSGAKNKNRLVMFKLYGEIEEADLAESERQELFSMSGLSKKDYDDFLQEQEEERKVKTVVKTPGEEVELLKKESAELPRNTAGSSRSTTKINKNDWKKAGKESEKHNIPAQNRHDEKSTVVRKYSLVDENDAQNEGVNENLEDTLVPRKKKRVITELSEVQTMLLRTRPDDRQTLQEILDSLFEGQFDKEEAEPYIEEVKEKIKKLDEAYIDNILAGYMDMTSEEGVEAYEKIAQADLLPELKTDALKQLERRLSKIKAEECELLVQKLQKEMKEAGIDEPERHHYYPAKKILEKEATQEEIEVVEGAKANYGAGLGLFEYPIWVVDTTRSQTGEKGMFLTPEQLYYSNLMTSYRMSIFSIDHVEAATGLLNKGLYVYQKGGTKTKLPYAVESDDLPKLAEVLDNFIKYLQEKPFSRKASYLAKEKHDTICCFRCGHVYKFLEACPKCGFKANE